MDHYKTLPVKDIIDIDYTCVDAWAVVKCVTNKDLNNPLVTYKQYYSRDKLQIYIISTHPTKGAADKALRKLRSQVELPKDDNDRPYHLYLTERQAQILTEALDLFSRIGMGQFGEIGYILSVYQNKNTSEDSYTKINKIDEIRRLAREAANIWMGSSGSYHGITSDNISDVFRVAWDLQQVIRHRLAWDRSPSGGLQVNFDTPLRSSQEPLAIIKKV